MRAAARETTTISGTSTAALTRCEDSGRRASESKTMRRGWWCTFSTRAVSIGSSASAVPIPIATASTDARQWWASSRLSTPEIHFESPSRVATLPSSVIADLKRTHGRPVRACLRKPWLSRRDLLRELAVRDDDLDALVAQDAQAAAGGLLGRVVRSDDDAADARGEDRVGARRRAAGVAARLERDVERGIAQIGVTAVGDRVDLGVGAAELLVPSLAQHPLPDRDDRADDGVGVDPAGAVRGERQRVSQVEQIGL